MPISRNIILILTLATIPVGQVAAHGGRTAADGCHNDSKNGGRHCHGGGTTAPQPARPTGTRDYYPNCTAARAAGPTPIYRGQRGYDRHLDRDGDGKACE
ncbi:excalibur calcium-binding domain-containing protein [Parasphingorhabdus sp.]|uniref:excalibur calcium-binding domain-containing protein n=1 Tax=Parasphingorhabdus sp. TaxID=2709688 RepID=UPI003A91B6F5